MNPTCKIVLDILHLCLQDVSAKELRDQIIQDLQGKVVEILDDPTENSSLILSTFFFITKIKR